MQNEFELFIDTCRSLGSRADYFQGGGGNVSLKVSESLMKIKASGFRISDITADQSLATVSYPSIKAFFENERDLKDHATLIEANRMVVEANTKHDSANLRPSMEVGFHSLLGKCVIHSHSVYANILNCSKEGRGIILDLFPQALIIPYVLPGAPLTASIKDALRMDNSIIFLINHGLVISADSVEEASLLHESVNTKIRTALEITAPYPTVKIIERDNSSYESASPYLKEVLLSIEKVEDTLLFPDQAVYLDNIAYNEGSSKEAKIHVSPEVIRYFASKNMALAYEETLVAWAYIVHEAKRSGYTLQTLSSNVLVS